MDQPTNEITKIGRTNRKNIFEKIYPRLMDKSKSTQKKKKRIHTKNYHELKWERSIHRTNTTCTYSILCDFRTKATKMKTAKSNYIDCIFHFCLGLSSFSENTYYTYVCVQYIFLPTSLCVSLVFISASSYSSSSPSSSSSRMSIHKASFEVLQFARRNERTATTTTKNSFQKSNNDG